MKTRNTLLTIVLVGFGILGLFLLMVAFVALILDIAGWLGLERGAGIDTQMSKNYDLVSGIGPLLITAFGFSGIIVTAWKHWNCHEPGCLKHGKYEVEGGVRLCDEHHPAHLEEGQKVGPAVRLHLDHLAHLKRRA